MIISVTSLKGGVGKSTVAQNLAVAFACMGYKVALVDTDTNASSLKRSGLRDENLPKVATFGLPDADALPKSLQSLSGDYEIVLIDGTPSLSKIVGTTLLLSNLTIIPIRPSGLDLRATQRFTEYFEQAKLLKDVKACLLLNQHTPQSNFSQEAADALSELGLPILQSRLHQRVAYAEAVPLGLGVYEHRDAKARQEVVQLTNEILQLIQNQ